ncbi:uncharacterized protein F4812DRAFT_377122 [Daldinia caldariorum]|uniref:uncharacterized protein n=1 Tax=Daldinia caldariorum TaxID=326644 RepID=UPI002008C455|nr:uncharacterized protein F4812DRAFT_377122 [Daldinia caldariorum]KAI1467805.1 hypothetical protein F4812DRAFT_377122 [Daldinia caldariorum]
MLVYSFVLRVVALCYYLALGHIGDVVLLFLFFFWLRGSIFPRFLEISYAKVSLGAVTVATAALIYSTKVRRRGQSVQLSVPWNGPGRPLLFPCRTTHTRLIPKKHSFSYSYLLVGIPVGWTGVAGGMISNDENKTGVEGWYKIDASDYLNRGNGHLGLRGELDTYLESQGVVASKYPYAYLVTAAKFMGYHFNPISFWYLYSADKHLTAMILEVNNTFDERRMYFLTIDNAIESLEASQNSTLEEIISTQKTGYSKPLRQTWPKDFHVSPFNSRNGTYSLTAHDPFSPNMDGQGLINNTINLISSKNHKKLVARIFSEGDAIDPSEMTFYQKFKFLASWWWVGFVTLPRIVKEAAVISFQKKLHVWYRPEPLKTSIGRHANKAEVQLEPLFRRYLRYLVEQSPESLTVRYVPCGIPDASIETMVSTPGREEPVSAKELEFKVLTPAFYSRFVYYAHDFEVIFCELSESNTIWVSNPKLLPRLFVKKQPPPPFQTANYLDYACFMAIKELRQRPERIERPLTSSQAKSTTRPQKDIRGFRLSSMDGYVLSHEDDKSRRAYINSVLALFLADRIALGSVDILQLELWAFRLLLAWALNS